MNFAQRMALGEAGEDLVERWLLDQGCAVFHASYARKAGGATMRVAEEDVVVPDLLVFARDTIAWAEVKTFSSRLLWNTGKHAGRWFHGIDSYLVEQYRRARELTHLSVDLFILDGGGRGSRFMPEPVSLLYCGDFIVNAEFVSLGDGLLNGKPTSQIPLECFEDLGWEQ